MENTINIQINAHHTIGLETWSYKDHVGYCGQSCPCCRSRVHYLEKRIPDKNEINKVINEIITNKNIRNNQFPGDCKICNCWYDTKKTNF